MSDEGRRWSQLSDVEKRLVILISAFWYVSNLLQNELNGVGKHDLASRIRRPHDELVDIHPGEPFADVPSNEEIADRRSLEAAIFADG